MSINQDVLTDLSDTTGMSADELRNQAPILPSQEPASINASASIVSGSQGETPVTDTVRAALLNPESTVHSVVEGVEHVSSMGDVLEEILGNSAISSVDVARAVPRFEGFDKAFNVNSFTKAPTSTNYAASCNFMKEKLRLRKEEVANQLNFFFGSSLTNAEEAFTMYREFYGAELIEKLTAFQTRFATWTAKRDHIHVQSLFTVGEDGGETNAATGEMNFISKAPGLSSLFDAKAFSAFQAAVNDFIQLKSSNLLVGSLLDHLNGNGSIEDFIEADQRIAAFGGEFTCYDIVSALGSTPSTQLLTLFEQKTEKAIERLYELEKEYKPDPNDFSSVRSFVIANGGEMDNLSYYCHYYSETVDLMRRLYLLATAYMDYFEIEK